MVRDCRRFLPVRSSHRVSTSLHPLAPPALPGFIATMSAVTPARGRACGLLNLAPFPCNLPRRSLHFTCLAFRALCLQPPRRSPDRFDTYSSASWASRFGTGLGFATPSQARQTARPNRVCLPTDCSFASGCSPPRLAADAVTSGFRLVGSPGWTFTSLTKHARGRTMAGTSPAMTIAERHYFSAYGVNGGAEWSGSSASPDQVRGRLWTSGKGGAPEAFAIPSALLPRPSSGSEHWDGFQGHGWDKVERRPPRWVGTKPRLTRLDSVMEGAAN